MEKTTYLTKGFVMVLLLLGLQSFAQNYVPFSPRFDEDLKGDIVLIGNNILGPNNNAFNNNSAYNHQVDMRYIDIDGDPSTFSSTSADLAIPNPNCYKIVYAGLYWGGVTSGSESITDVKFRGPTGGYNDITGTVIFNATSFVAGNSLPYSCYADVTDIVTSLGGDLGTYTVANVSSAEGETNTFTPRNGTGYSAGWSLFVVYEDPTLPGKSITSFDGFSAISSAVNLDIPISGFRTIPAPAPVRANLAFATLEGDSPIRNDRLKLNGVSLSAADRDANNFFNSSVTQLSATPVTNRNPNSTNTLGFDTGVMVVPNPSNNVIANNATDAVIRLESSQDTYFQYFFALAVEIIEPKIVLTKIVEDNTGTNIGGETVELGDQLNYVIGFQNTGNDNATDLTIRDVLPTNVVFDYPSDIATLPAGVSVESYNAATRELIFRVDRSVVEENDPVQEIRFAVTVVATCSLLSDACSNLIDNQAFATYKGTLNPSFTISDDPSFSENTGCLLNPGATNFLADINDCVFEEEVILCGASTELVAANGYNAYTWSSNASLTPVLGNTQSITVTETGTYYVYNEAVAPCQSITQVFNVVNFGTTVSNPVIPFADEVVVCPNDGKELPNIFLCGANDSTSIQTGISDTSSMIWEKLNEGSCDAVINQDCANESNSCTWNQVQTGPNFEADTAGQYRLTLNYAGGCFSQYYFNVYENILEPNVTARDIYCTTPGEIVVGGVPSGYEYSIDGTNYQDSNVFSVSTADIYTVYIKQIGVSPNPCIFTVPDVQVRDRNFTGSTITTQPFCNGEKGSISIAANDVRPQYSFSIYSGVLLINSVGPINENNYEFENLNPGFYTVNVSTEDGCAFSETIEIINPPLLTATSALTSPLTCSDGEITVYPEGGTPPYFYFVNSTTEFQTVPTIVVNSAGVYDIQVVDSNNCVANTSITVDAILAPSFTVNDTDITCIDAGDVGEIEIDVTNPNGNALAYSIDNGVTFVNSPNFTGLAVGDYEVVVQYTSGTDVCTSAPETINISALPAINGTATLTTDYTCDTDGVITVSGVTGGDAPYEYSINGVDYQTGLTFSNLTNGSYTVTIKDDNDCTFTTAPIIIDNLNPPTDLDFSSSALTCPTNTSEVTITAVGGEAPLEYQIIAPTGSSTGYQDSNIFTGLSAGTYTFQVRDSKSCVYSEAYIIDPLPGISVVGQPIEDVSCFEATDGEVEFTVSGTSNFTYTINGGTTTTGTSIINLSNLAAGNYVIVITDTDTNCTATNTVNVNTPSAQLSINLDVTPITCIAEGTVTINSTGGWGGNTYELTLPDNSVLTSSGSHIFTNLTQTGDYIAKVTDANGCEVTTPFTLDAPSTPTATINTASNFCYSSTSGAALEVDATGGQPPYEYNINSGAFQTSNTFTDLAPGNYIVTVRDAYGCAVILPAETIADPVSVDVELTKELDCTVSPEAVISGTISDGYAPYTVTLIQGAGTVNLTGNTFTLETTTSGAYEFEITDAQGCTVVSNIINVNTISTPTVTALETHVTCNASTDGTVTLTASGGSGGYTYSDDNVTFSASNTFTGLGAGIHTFYVRDSKNCTNTVSATITEPTALVATANATTFACSVTNTKEAATITIAVPTTGTAPYQYSFNGGSTFTTTNTLTVNDDGTTQTFSYVVKDANGCVTAPQNISIEPLNPPTDLSISATDITCLVTESTATLIATNGAGVLQYETIAPSPIIVAQQTSNVFNNLSAGTYVFRVTDANGCYYTESYTIDPVTNINVSGLKLSDALCNGDTNGSAQFTVSQFGATYSYTINGGTAITGQTNATITLSGLPAGAQTIVVTDEATGCTATETVTITEPSSSTSVSAVATNVHCNNYDSQITITASGGTPNYTYATVLSGAVPASTDYTSSNIVTVDTNSGANLIWDVYAKDANGCTAFTSVTIIAEALPTVTAPAVSNQCTATSGFTFTVSGTGVAPLSYSINGGATYQSSPTFTVNTPNSYTITIKDGNGCTATSTTTTDVYAPLEASVLLSKDLTCALPVEASVDIQVSGGNAPYTYEVSTNGGSSYSSISGSPYTTTVAGTYQFRITDANGCDIVTNSVTINNADNPVILSLTQTQFISCNAEETAAIDISIDNTVGLAPFIINVTNTTTGTDYGTQTSGLAAGTYVVTVTDAKGCFTTDSITIAEPTTINLDFDVDPITCGVGGVSLGQIIINSVSGGTPNYSYHVTGVNGYDVELPNQTGATQVFEVVDFGLYEIRITDANGCTALEQNILVASPPDNLDIDINTTADCLTGGTAEVSIGTALTGSGPYYFAIYEGPGMTYTSPTTTPWQDEDSPGHTTFTGLIPGATYTFIVFDDLTDCYYYETSSTPIPTNSTLTTSAIVANNITCEGSADGTVSVDITSVYGIDTAVNYEIYNSQSLVSTGVSGVGIVPANSTLSISNLGPLDFGNYVVIIEETLGVNAGCSVVTTPFNITESAIELGITALSTKNENCNELGIISATATDGTSPYEYQAVISGNSTVATNWTASNTFSLAAGTYDVYVRDAYGCIRSATETVDEDLESTINPIAPQCFDGTPFNITLVEGTGTAIAPLTYSIGGAYQSSPNFQITAANTYTISVKDGNGCIATGSYVVNAPMALDAILSKELDCTVSPGAIIDLTATGGTGTYTYEVNYNSTGYSAISGTPYTANADGTYQFRVTDTQSCTAESSVVVVEAEVVPTFTTIETEVTCNSGADGSIVVTATGGIAPFEYSIDGGAFQSSNVFDGLAQGSYDIVVRDSKSCESVPASVSITEPTVVTGSGTLTQELTCGTSNETQQAIVTITASGGTAPYTYSFDGGANYTTTNTYNTFTSGTVSALIKDANGCVIGTAIDVVVPALDAPTDLDFASTAVTCDVVSSEVTLTVTNGVAPFSFEIISPSASATTNTTGVFTGLTPDDYVFTVTDANGCFYTESYTVDPVTNIAVSGLLVDDVSCAGGNDGAVDFTVSNFAGTYSYTINGGTAVTGQTNPVINLTGLSVGNQTIVVTDEVTNCTSTATVTVSEPILLTLVESSNINANCNIGAQVTVAASNGTAPYQYAFVEDGIAPSSADYTNLANATLDPSTNTNWDVWVMDSNGCTTSIDVTIATDTLPNVDVPALAANQCNLTGDAYTFTVTNPTGIAPFEYSIGNGYQTSTTFTVSNAGDYSVTIKDANGCTFTNATPIAVYDALDVTSTIVALPSCTVNDGEITVSGQGGSGNYTFSISPSTGITQAGNSFSGLAALTNYTVTVTDVVTNCTNTVDINLEGATPVSFTSTPTSVTCVGDMDGTISVNLDASNNNPIYSYAIIAGPATFVAQSSNVFTGLATGDYTVEVTSGRGCVETEIVTVGTPTAIVVSTATVQEYACIANTNSSNAATITVTGVTGGSGNYVTYEFIRNSDGVVVQSNSSNVYTETTLLGGTYTVNVYDDKNCLGSTSATINPYVSIENLSVAVDNVITCTNNEDITVTFMVSGGTATNFEFTLIDTNGIIANQTNTTGSFTGLPIGNYNITVENLDTGCSLETVHNVSNPDTFDLIVENIVDVTCFSDTDGSIEITFVDLVPTPSDNAGAFAYTITNASGTVVETNTTTSAGPVSITGLASGSYTVDASLVNAPFCSVSKNFAINAPTEALAITETHTEITCVSGNSDGSISASAVGGWPGGYEYQLSNTSGTVIIPFGNESSFTDLTAGNYTVTVRDSKGCEDLVDVQLVDPTPVTITASADVTTLNCFGDANASITVTSTLGGQGSNYLYTLNMVAPTVSSSGPQTSTVFSDLGAGTYNVTVTDGYNCTETSADITIIEPSRVESLLVKSTSQTCIESAELTLSASGGTAPYEYSETSDFATIIGTFTTNVTFDAAPGTYMYYVRDANGCFTNVSNEITIEPLLDLVVNLDTTNSSINCTGDTTGVIIAKAEGGLGNYVYTLQDASGTDISPAPNQNSPGVFTDLPEGNYLVEVESGDCLEVNGPVSITGPVNPLNVAFTVENVTCPGINNGVLDINATGGTGIIKYAISPRLDQFVDDSTFDELAPGIYQAVVQDELGCFVIIDFEVEDATPLLLSIVPNSIYPAVCEGDMDGEFSVELSGGEMPYSVVLDDIDGAYTVGTATQTQFDFTNLEGGDHVVYVIDNLGCETEWNISFPESVLIDPQVEVEYACTNDMATNAVTITVDESNTDLTELDFSLDGGGYQASNIFANVPAGLGHYVDVRHTNGCIKRTELFDISNIEPVELVLEEGGLNEIVALASGGVEPYEFTLNGESFGSTSTFVYYESGDYTVTVTDRNGCSATATKYFEFVDVCITNYFTPNGDGVLDEWGPGCTNIYSDLTFDIFDRYGRVVATLRAGQKWNGKYHGKELPTGDYWYVVKLNDSRNNREFVGHFTLYR